MDWNELLQRLTRELMHLPANAFVIVQGPGGFPYVQAMRYLNGLDAEAVSNTYLPRPLDAGQEKRMAALGWRPPDGQDRYNWWCRVLVPSELADITAEQAAACRDLADRMVTAFRDVYGVYSPDDLVYQASRNGDNAGPIRLPGLGLPHADAEPEEAATAPEPPGPAPEPAPLSIEDELSAAKSRGDQQAYLDLVMGIELYVPEAAGHYATAIFNDGTYVLAYTSAAALEQSAGRRVRHTRASFANLAHDWPKPEWQLAINARLPSAAFIDARTIRRIAERARAESAPEILVEPPPPTPTVALLQKVVRPEHVTHYIEGGYDRVAGYVHRVQDVGELHTPERLVRGLGLAYAGSPFSTADAETHVIRWPVVKPSLVHGAGYTEGEGGAGFPEFRIDSQRLPHGAELYRIDRSGKESLVAVYNSDLRGWVR